MKKWMMPIVVGAFALSLAGCNTMIGAGKDIERGGEKIQDASLKVRADWRNAREGHERSYDAARAACNSGTESQRDACRDKARADYTARLNADRTTYRRKEMRSASEQERMEDAYEEARDRCDALKGEAEDRCVADARTRYRR
jgi:predicted small secreted protein